jgi:glyoxylase-like metal-dependent hydrolase (beta-lactamase superfamily II)
VTVRTVLAPNPGPYTGPGTNTYLISDGVEVVVLDPGPRIAVHHAEIVAAIGDLTAVAVVATHTHPDHAPLANPLAAALQVPVVGFGAGPDFAPDRTIGDGGTVEVGRLELAAVHTPGHTPDHLCFRLGDRLFTGDHIMGGSTVIIEDAAAYLDSLYKVRDLGVARIDPGHGAAMNDAAAVIDEYIDHRQMRERQLLAAIADGADTVVGLVAAVYGDVPTEIVPAAAHQVRVQLVKLSRDGAVLLLPGGAGEDIKVELTREP